MSKKQTEYDFTAMGQAINQARIKQGWTREDLAQVVDLAPRYIISIVIPTCNMAANLRKMAIDGYIIQVDHTDIKAMTAEIQKIGVNINQIAKRVNATGSAYQEDIDEIKGVLMRHK